jgi:hypothetical protein
MWSIGKEKITRDQWIELIINLIKEFAKRRIID